MDVSPLECDKVKPHHVCSMKLSMKLCQDKTHGPFADGYCTSRSACWCKFVLSVQCCGPGAASPSFQTLIAYCIMSVMATGRQHLKCHQRPATEAQVLSHVLCCHCTRSTDTHKHVLCCHCQVNRYTQTCVVLPLYQVNRYTQ